MSEFPIQPLFDKVFVIKDSAETDESGDFYLPDSVKGRAKTGTVMAIGPGYLDLVTGKFIPTTLKVGDRVYVKEFDGYTIEYTDKNKKTWKVFVFGEKDIIGRLVEGE